MERRQALRILGAGVVAERLTLGQHHMVQIAMAPETYRLQFFSKDQNLLLDRLTEMIIPTDDHSPGASDAHVSYFIDLLVANSGKPVQQSWTLGLKAVNASARARFEQPFLNCTPAQQDQVLTAMASGETKPISALEQFFVQLKQMTINGYYTSSVGIHKDLRYQGNTALPDYYGCNHPEHRS